MSDDPQKTLALLVSYLNELGVLADCLTRTLTDLATSGAADETLASGTDVTLAEAARDTTDATTRVRELALETVARFLPYQSLNTPDLFAEARARMGSSYAGLTMATCENDACPAQSVHVMAAEDPERPNVASWFPCPLCHRQTSDVRVLTLPEWMGDMGLFWTEAAMTLIRPNGDEIVH